MTGMRVSIGYIPLLDAAPVIMAHEMGFAAQEGLALDLHAAPSWSSLRDMLSFGQVDAAHMLSPVPVASALGLGGARADLCAVSVLSVNGNVVCVSNALADALRECGHRFDVSDARAAGEALICASKGERLRIGIPFPFSMHSELVYYWLSALGLPAPQNVDVHTVPPALMADALKNGEVDAFCVGEPWGTKAVELGYGEILLTGSAIWSFAPEKVLATRTEWAEAERAIVHRLIRAVWRTNRWLCEPASRTLTSEVLARPEYLGLSSEWLDRALAGRLVINSAGDERSVEKFVGFWSGDTTYPWPAQGAWIGERLAARLGLDREGARAAAASTFRHDIYEAALGGTSANLPGHRVDEMAETQDAGVAVSAAGSSKGASSAFFDGRIFDPSLSD